VSLRLLDVASKVQDQSQVVDSENLLCSTFAIMTRTEGTEVLFKEALERLKGTSPCNNPNHPKHTVRDGVTSDFRNATPKLR
jgi:hypothetical protein